MGRCISHDCCLHAPASLLTVYIPLTSDNCETRCLQLVTSRAGRRKGLIDGMLNTDVLVIGGGPAGLTAAIAARLKGFDVAVADAAHPPIDKACGEGLM